MYKKMFLDNDIPVLFEKTAGARSAVVGFWIKVGSRHEPADKSGISHFLEHMFFKGTHSRTTEDIAVEIDSIGGDLNAFTSREYTTYYVRVLDEYLDKGLDLICDLIVNSTFNETEIEKEKGIVEEEIRLTEDTPDEYAFDLFNTGLWGSNGLGRPILGTSETVRRLRRDDILNHIKAFYTNSNMLVVCTGSIDTEKAVRMLNEKLSGIGSSEVQIEPDMPQFVPEVNVYPKDLSEVHICVGFRGIRQNSPQRYALMIVNTLLGSGVSSRLFQEIREKRGLVYSIHSFLLSYHDVGCVGIYAGSGKEKYEEVIDLIIQQACSLKDTITEEELKRTKNQLKGNIILALESTSARMNNLGKQEIYYGRYFPLEEIIMNLEKIDLQEVRDFSERVFRNDLMAMTLLGPVKGKQ